MAFLPDGRTVSVRVNKVPRTRWDIIPELLESSGLDAVVAVSPENVTYTTGHFEYTLPTLRDRIAATIISTTDKPVYLVVDVVEGAAKRNSWISDVRGYKENKESPIRVLAAILEEQGLTRRRVAVELEYLSAAYMKELLEYLPQVTFEDGSIVLARARSIKTPQEIDHISASVRATERAHHTVCESLKPGDTEIEIVRRLQIQNLIEGADYVTHAVVEAGANALEGHHVPDSTPIKPGDIVGMDHGGRFAGYVSDIARPVVVGKPTDHQKAMWARLWAAHRKGIDSIRVGVTAGEALRQLREDPRNRDIWFYGHGIGTFTHDPPMLTQYYPSGLRTTTNITAQWTLEPDMLVYVEFSLLDKEGGQAYTIEDLVHVTENGPRILSTESDTEELFVVS